MLRTRVADGGDSLHVWMVAANILNKQYEHPTRGGPPAWGLGEGLTTHRKKQRVMKCYAGHRSVCSCKHGNEPLGFIKGGEFLI